MPRSAFTPEEIEEHRGRVIEAATHLFAQEGFEAVTMRAIGRLVGCSPTTPYTYFENKQEIFAAVRTAAFSRFANCLERATRGLRDPISRLRAMSEAYLRFAHDNPDPYRLMFELRQGEMADYPPLKAERERSFRQPLEAARDAIESGALTGDALTLAHIVWASCHGIVSLDLAGQLDLGRGLFELVAPMVETFLAAHRPKADSTPSRTPEGAHRPARPENRRIA